MSILLDKARPGMPVIVEENEGLFAGTVIAVSQETGEVGVRRESNGGESKLFPLQKVYVSIRKKNEVRKISDLENYIVAINEGKISPGGLTEIATEIKKRRPVEEIRTQSLLEKYYRYYR